MFPGTSLEGGQSRPSRFQENFSDPGLASPSPPGDYPASPGSHGGGAFQNPEGATRSGPPSRLKRPPTSEVGRNPYNASIRPSIIGDNNPGGPFTTVTLSEHNYGSTSRNRGTHRDSLGDASHRTGEQENRSPSISERCIAWSIACSIAFMRIGGQVMPSVGLGFLFLGTKLEYFYVPEFAEDGTHEVWEELYPEPKDHDGGGGGGSKGPSVRWSVMWLAWGLCVLTTVYSAFAYCVFLRHFLTKRDRGWFGPLHAAAELGMFALWFAASMCMTLYVLIPLTKKNNADAQDVDASWAARTPLEYKTRFTTILCWTTAIAFGASACLTCVQSWRNRSRAGLRGPFGGGGGGARRPWREM